MNIFSDVPFFSSIATCFSSAIPSSAKAHLTGKSALCQKKHKNPPTRTPAGKMPVLYLSYKKLKESVFIFWRYDRIICFRWLIIVDHGEFYSPF